MYKLALLVALSRASLHASDPHEEEFLPLGRQLDEEEEAAKKLAEEQKKKEEEEWFRTQGLLVPDEVRVNQTTRKDFVD